ADDDVAGRVHGNTGRPRERSRRSDSSVARVSRDAVTGNDSNNSIRSDHAHHVIGRKVEIAAAVGVKSGTDAVRERCSGESPAGIPANAWSGGCGNTMNDAARINPPDLRRDGLSADLNAPPGEEDIPGTIAGDSGGVDLGGTSQALVSGEA